MPKPCQVLDVADSSRLIERISRIVDIIHKMQQDQTIDHIDFREDFTAWGSRALTGDERCTRHAR